MRARRSASSSDALTVGFRPTPAVLHASAAQSLSTKVEVAGNLDSTRTYLCRGLEAADGKHLGFE